MICCRSAFAVTLSICWILQKSTTSLQSTTYQGSVVIFMICIWLFKHSLPHFPSLDDTSKILCGTRTLSTDFYAKSGACKRDATSVGCTRYPHPHRWSANCDAQLWPLRTIKWADDSVKSLRNIKFFFSENFTAFSRKLPFRRIAGARVRFSQNSAASAPAWHWSTAATAASGWVRPWCSKHFR